MGACVLPLLLLSCMASVSQAVVWPENAILDLDSGEWSRYFDVDDAWGAEDWGNTGDVESHKEIYIRRGKSCVKSIPCYGKAEAMDIKLSKDHLKDNPNANITEILMCTRFPDGEGMNPSIGFSCINKYQRVEDSSNPIPSWCNSQCKKNGQFDIYDPVPDNNCFRCANFKVAYFCLYDNYNCEEGEIDRGDEK